MTDTISAAEAFGIPEDRLQDELNGAAQAATAAILGYLETAQNAGRLPKHIDFTSSFLSSAASGVPARMAFQIASAVNAPVDAFRKECAAIRDIRVPQCLAAALAAYQLDRRK